MWIGYYKTRKVPLKPRSCRRLLATANPVELWWYNLRIAVLMDLYLELLGTINAVSWSRGQTILALC